MLSARTRPALTTRVQLIGFLIIGAMLLCTVQALGELAVLYPVNGAFFTYACRFLSESWGFSIGYNYALSWLTILPYEITAACITISFWDEGAKINPGVWVAVFLVALTAIQFFGVRGYGEGESPFLPPSLRSAFRPMSVRIGD